MAALLVLPACKGATEVCDPSDPLCSGGGGGTVANITVDSPVDTVMAVGRTVPMTATATNSTGGPVTVTFIWNSTNTTVATVNGSGVVSADAAGTTTIQASAQSETGSIAMRAVDADLVAVTAALTDPFTASLGAALSGTPASALNTILTTCGDHVASGHVRALDQCLTNALGVSPADGDDQALLGVLALFFAYAQAQLNL
jgi:hypothetical protein